MFGVMYLWAYSSVYFEKVKRDKIRKEELYKVDITNKPKKLIPRFTLYSLINFPKANITYYSN